MKNGRAAGEHRVIQAALANRDDVPCDEERRVQQLPAERWHTDKILIFVPSHRLLFRYSPGVMPVAYRVKWDLKYAKLFDRLSTLLELTRNRVLMGSSRRSYRHFY